MSVDREGFHCRVDPPTDRVAEPKRPAKPSVPRYDSWELDEDLRHVERLLMTNRGVEPPARPARASRDEPRYRVDRAHAAVPARHRPTVRKRKRHNQPAPFSWVSALAWFVFSIGTMTLACGGVLLGWSWLDGRPELWSIGIPCVLAGQVAVFGGLVLQLARIAHSHRVAAARMESVDERLDELRTTTRLIGTTHGPSATFYAHWADGAGPQLLLSDLKSQLDLLAVKLAEDK